MSQSVIANGTKVIFTNNNEIELEAVVKSHSRGWYVVTIPEADNKAYNARAKQLVVANEIVAEDIPKDNVESWETDEATKTLDAIETEEALEDAEITENNMSSNMSKYRKGYKADVTVTGNRTMHNGDEVAMELNTTHLDDIYTMVAEEIDAVGAEFVLSKRVLKGYKAAMETPELTTLLWLQERYGHLNLGSQRMNLGNILRNVRSQAL